MKNTLTLLIFGLCIISIHAQTSINSTGGIASGIGGSVSFSVGQLVYTTNTGINGSLVQGVQQPYEITIKTAIEQAKGINLSITAYPNPTNNNLLLNISNFDISNLYYELYDMNGKILLKQKVISNETNIVMSNLLPATYFLKLIQENKEIKSFKIIKK
jgi:hypothetical protein